jgi:hypothetical protein
MHARTMRFPLFGKNGPKIGLNQWETHSARTTLHWEGADRVTEPCRAVPSRTFLRLNLGLLRVRVCVCRRRRLGSPARQA